MDLAAKTFWLFTFVSSTAGFSDNPDISHLHAAGSYARSQQSVKVERLPSKFVVNRFGDRVPQFKPGEEVKQIMHLKYLTLRGLGDLPALILEVGGIPYRATYFTKRDFSGLVKPKLEFGRLPVLEADGQELAQSASIIRYLATKAGLAGASETERARVDALYETLKDLFVSHGVWGKSFDVEALRRGPTQGERVLHFRETSNRGEFTPFQKAAAGLKTFEDVLAGSATGYLVGGNLSYVDLALWLQLQELGQEDKLGPGWADRLSFSQLGAFTTRLYENSIELVSFVNSGRRMPRVKLADGDYVYQKEEIVPVPSVPKIGGGQEL